MEITPFPTPQWIFFVILCNDNFQQPHSNNINLFSKFTKALLISSHKIQHYLN